MLGSAIGQGSLQPSLAVPMDMNLSYPGTYTERCGRHLNDAGDSALLKNVGIRRDVGFWFYSIGLFHMSFQEYKYLSIYYLAIYLKFGL